MDKILLVLTPHKIILGQINLRHALNFGIFWSHLKHFIFLVPWSHKMKYLVTFLSHTWQLTSPPQDKGNLAIHGFLLVWVGFADNKGDHLTWKILTDDTNTIIIRSAVRSATKTSPNLRLDPPKGEDPQDLTSDVFVYGRPNPDGSDHTPCCRPSSLCFYDTMNEL